MNILNSQNIFLLKNITCQLILLPKEVVSSFRQRPGALAPLSMAVPAVGPDSQAGCAVPASARGVLRAPWAGADS